MPGKQHASRAALGNSSAIEINPLSVAKGQKNLCELCAKPARLQCARCRVTYYCSANHQATDAAGIHDRICALVGALRSLRPTLGSAEEREKRALTVAMSKHALIDLCKIEANKSMIAHRYALAVPAALQALRYSVQVYGTGRLELAPSYLLLAEATLGMSQLKQAEEYLLYANWVVLQSNSSCPASIQSSLHGAFGRLYMAQARYQLAVQSFAQDIYYCSLENGPEHIETAHCYYMLGTAFDKMQRNEHALAVFDQVIDIWYKFAISMKNRRTESISDYLSATQIAQAVDDCLSIVHIRRERCGTSHISTGEAIYTLALLKHLSNFDKDARYLYAIAEQIYALTFGADNESTQAIVRARNEMPAIQQQIVEVISGLDIDTTALAATMPSPSSVSTLQDALSSPKHKKKLSSHSGIKPLSQSTSQSSSSNNSQKNSARSSQQQQQQSRSQDSLESTTSSMDAIAHNLSQLSHEADPTVNIGAVDPQPLVIKSSSASDDAVAELESESVQVSSGQEEEKQQEVSV